MVAANCTSPAVTSESRFGPAWMALRYHFVFHGLVGFLIILTTFVISTYALNTPVRLSICI